MIHASLFSGIGGPEVAAAMMGWENAFHCEINPFGRAVLDYWFPESKSYEDITKTSFKEWRGRVDVLTGGFPCQPFSYAGKRGGREDERYLWPEMLRVIDEVRPAWVVGKNVAGITTMVEGGVLSDLGGDSSLFTEGDDVHRYELDQSFTIERICGDLERLGYSVQPVLVPAAAVGAPHRRDRIFIIAHSDTLGDGFCGYGEPAVLGRRNSCTEHSAESEVQGFTPDPFGGGYRTPGEDGKLKGDGDNKIPLKGERREQTERIDGLSAIQRPASDTDRCGQSASKLGCGRDREEGVETGSRVPFAGIVGSGASDDATDTLCRDGQGECQMERPEPGRDGTDRNGGEWSASHTDCEGRQEPIQSRRGTYQAEAGARLHDRVERPGSDGDATHPDLPRLEKERSKLQTTRDRRGSEKDDADTDSGGLEGTSERQGKRTGNDALWCRGIIREDLLPEQRWRDFPTVSPVHRGDDGLPFSMDDLTVSPTKWRTESLKAYGNSIVVQVMYRIFQAIEKASPE